MFRFLDELFHAIFGESFNGSDPQTGLENQLRIMYGRGEISREVYKQLRLRLQWNQIGKGDLILLHQSYLRKVASQGMILDYEKPETRRLLDRLYLDKVLMEEAAENIISRQKSLVIELGWLNEQAESAHSSAQAALPDEMMARTYLEIWHDLQTAAKDLLKRQQALEQYRRKMEAQSAELKAAVTRLSLLQSQERLVELNLHIRQDLLLLSPKKGYERISK